MFAAVRREDVGQDYRHLHHCPTEQGRPQAGYCIQSVLPSLTQPTRYRDSYLYNIDLLDPRQCPGYVRFLNKSQSSVQFSETPQ
jgi:hypothetical protein